VLIDLKTDKQLLKQKLREWIDEFEKRKGGEA